MPSKDSVSNQMMLCTQYKPLNVNLVPIETLRQRLEQNQKDGFTYAVGALRKSIHWLEKD